jgi:hypothetical protein
LLIIEMAGALAAYGAIKQARRRECAAARRAVVPGVASGREDLRDARGAAARLGMNRST